jgi:hypothetical protein
MGPKKKRNRNLKTFAKSFENSKRRRKVPKCAYVNSFPLENYLHMHNLFFCDFCFLKEKKIVFDCMVFQSFRGVEVSCHFLGCLLAIRSYVCEEKHLILWL